MTTAALALTPARTAGPLRRFIRRFVRQPIAVGAVVFLILLALIAIFAPLIAPYSPSAQSLGARNAPPSAEHWLGTDSLGRDLFSRMVWGTRVTLIAPFIAVAVGLILGIPTGLVAGYRGGKVDAVSGRVADAFLAMPGIVLAMAIIAARGPSTFNAMVAVGLVFAPRLFRVVRGATISVREETFVDASIVAGAPDRRLIFAHILPNVAPAVIVQSTILLGVAVLAEAGLSFLGIGVQPPTSTWGVLLRRGFDDGGEGLQTLVPGAAITLLILSFQFVGDGLRDSLGREVRRG